MLWIPLTVSAAFFQNLRSAIQRHLKSELTDLGAASVRFIYAAPFALIWLAGIAWLGELSLPELEYSIHNLGAWRVYKPNHLHHTVNVALLSV